VSFLSRREFLALSCVAVTGARSGWLRRQPQKPQSPHPTPRPGVDASKVLAADQVKGSEDVIAAFDEVRQIPAVIDGIRCHCGCAERPGYYSLLTCFEQPTPMALHCDQCQGHARYAFRLHKSGKSLDEIRVAIDARYG
jgi:hypothetical protein